MQRIYTHIGNSPMEPHFDPENLRNSQRDELGVSDKPSYGLWASPFNDKSSCQWEWYLATEMNKNAHRRERQLEDIEHTRFDMYLNSRGLTRDQYYALPADKFRQINSDYGQLPPTYTKEEMAAAQAMDREDRLNYGAHKRECAFHFYVNQDNILHVHDIRDIAPYLQFKEGYSLWRIDFDKIKADGHSGMELHNATKMRGTIFWSWDVDSIVIWDPDCVKPVDRNIAYIARSIADAKDEFDARDPLSDDVTLARWLADNIDVIDKAVADGVFEPKEVATFIERAIELDNQRRGLDTNQQYVESQSQGEEMLIEK